MQTATNHATGAPKTSAGTPCPLPNQSTGRCLIHSDTLLDSILKAKQHRHQHGQGYAYTQLLKLFHRTILPAFITKAGNLSEAARLLGIHRGTLRSYALQADLKEVQ